MLIQNDEKNGAFIIDEVSDNLMYLGYPSNGAPTEADAKWAIKRIQKNGTVTRVQWADGLTDKNYKWTERASLEYSYLK